MSIPDLSRARWRTSSYSNPGGNADCVEVAFARQRAAVRDSKDPDGPVLLLPTGGWQRFLSATSRL